MPTRLSHEYVVVRYNDTVVAKLAGGGLIPNELAQSDAFVIDSIASPQELSEISVANWNTTEMSDGEKTLLNAVYAE